MKKVVFNSDKSIISFDEINDDHIVGIQWINGPRSMVLHSEKGFVGVTNDDMRYAWMEDSKRNYVGRARAQGCSVYVFSSYSELYRWMAGECVE